jgi:hypothetical protein
MMKTPCRADTETTAGLGAIGIVTGTRGEDRVAPGGMGEGLSSRGGADDRTPSI